MYTDDHPAEAGQVALLAGQVVALLLGGSVELVARAANLAHGASAEPELRGWSRDGP